MLIDLVALIVKDYDRAIRFFVDVLEFELVEDSLARTNDGRPKRWVVVRPAGGATGILLARADGADQEAAVGRQFAGRVGFFLRVENFATTYARLVHAGVPIVSPPRVEPYGEVAVFLDVEGNRWDLLGPGGTDAEQELLAVVQDWDHAMLQNDAEAIGRFMADDWTITGSDGKSSHKETFLGLIRAGTLSHDVMRSDDVTVRVYGDVAVVTAHGVSGGIYQGRPFREVEHQLNVFVRQGSEWRCVLTHLSGESQEP